MAEPGPLCIYEKRDPHIAIIKLNRPEKKNAISRDLYWALDAAWQKAKADDDVWSIILTGSADAFCVGGDLKENIAFARGEMTGPRSGPRGYSSLRPLQMHKPIIAAINGYAVGGGFSLALSCHIRYCVPASKFGCSEVRWSHLAAWPSYVGQLPSGWAYWFALTGQMIDADTAFRLGLVQKICEPDKLDRRLRRASDYHQPQRPADCAALHRVHRRQVSLRITGVGKGFRSASGILRPPAQQQGLRRRLSRLLRTAQTGIFARVLQRKNQIARRPRAG